MKNGLKIMDSDLHVMEPDDLWERYLGKPFRDRLPRFQREAGGPSQQPRIVLGDLTIGVASKRDESVRAEARLQEVGFLSPPAPGKGEGSRLRRRESYRSNEH